MKYIRKELESYRDEAGTDGSTLTSTESKVHRLASKIEKVREKSKGAKANRRATANRPNQLW